MSNSLGKQAYTRLYGEEPKRKIVIRYHGRFSDYNANIKQTTSTTEFGLSRKFEKCEPEIQIGVMQHLLNRINKTKIETVEQDLYNTFLQKLSDFAPITETDHTLGESFHRVNEEYFDGLMTMPNLVWGNRTRTLLGTYTYATDTITISRVLEGAPEDVFDWVMYHEMLHKKHKFSCSSGRTHSHTPAFKRDEAKYRVRDAERLLTRWLAGRRKRTRVVEERSFLARVMGWR